MTDNSQIAEKIIHQLGDHGRPGTAPYRLAIRTVESVLDELDEADAVDRRWGRWDEFRHAIGGVK